MKPGRLICVAPALLLALAIPPVLLADTILDDFQVNVEPPGHPPQNSPYSAADWETETIYTTWLSQRDGINWDVGLQLFDYDLQTIGEVLYLNVREGTYDCEQPRLVVGNQGVGAAWIEAREPNRILFRSLDASGNPISPPVRAEDNFDNVARDSLSIATLDSGYILAWYDERDTSAIWAQIVDLGGNLIGANFPIRPDSTGGILGLEAQNHPDGRVLVSWVTDGQYSRGRWLDAEGNFMGEVFEMAEAYPTDEIIESITRFEAGGTGMLYQYSDSLVGNLYDYSKFSYVTHLDSMGMQTGQRVQNGIWYDFYVDGFLDRMTYSFPDLIFLPDSDRVHIKLYDTYGYSMGGFEWAETYNKLYSSVLGNYIIPWGIVGEGNYDLCQLNEGNFLYTFDLEYIGLRKYEIATLDSSQGIVWIGEPGFGSAQGGSDICVHLNGSFRIIYDNWLGPEPLVYTRFFYSDGTPSAPDTLVSMDENFYHMMTCAGRIEKTNDDAALIIWPCQNDIMGTTYTASTWSGEIEDFDCDHPVCWWSVPSFDINESDHVILMWEKKWQIDLWYWFSQFYCKSYSQIFNPISGSFSVGPEYNWYYPIPCDVELLNDGRFLTCWAHEEVFIQRGTNYNQLVGELVCTGYPCTSAPILDKSDTGYWLTWTWSDSVYLQQLDSDGNLIGDAQIISEDDAVTTGDPDLAVSETDNFAVVWQDARMDEGDIFCRQFNPDGSTFGREYRVNSDPVGPLQKEPAVAFGPEDRLYFTWTDFRNEGGQGDIYCKVIEWNDALSVEEEPAPIPHEFALYPASPNPFNLTTQIRYSLPHDGHASLTVHNLLGQTVAVLTEGFIKAGNHQVTFDGSGLASGIYIVRLQSEDQAESRKMVLMK